MMALPRAFLDPLALGALTLCLTLGAGACTDPDDPREPVDPDLVILAVNAPDPLIEGSTLYVTLRGLLTGSGGRLLRITTATGARATLSENLALRQGAILAFTLDGDSQYRLGIGTHPVDVALIQDHQVSPDFATVLSIANEITLRLDTSISGIYHRNESTLLSGAGFISAQEGALLADFVGTFTPASGESSRVVNARLPIRQAERNQRDRGTLVLTTALGGFRPGTFEGTLRLDATLRAGTTLRSNTLPVTLNFLGPTIYDATPEQPYLGQIITIRGNGFLGDPDATDDSEATMLRFHGEIEIPTGERLPFGPKEAVVQVHSGQEVQLGLEVEVQDGELISSFFGVRNGRFRGTVTPIVIKGHEDDFGEAIPMESHLRGVQQVVLVRFLPGYFDSLRHFGLSAAADALTAKTIERMQEIYLDYNVAFTIAPPDDFLPSAVAVVEIGGPDPNGLGLFGYDNTPGKDVGNLRLHDHIGGANATTQADGYPGFGGVFIDSLMHWSAHPIAPGVGGQEPEPLFDDIFDPVRAQPVSLEEVNSLEVSTRLEAVRRAIRALAYIVGETAAHELGHSLGLAQPYGPANQYHSAVPDEGCIMDAGGFRPLGERAGEPGFAPTRFCADEPAYLQSILPLP